MSIIPAKNVTLTLYEGSTLDETFAFTDAEGNALDLTGWSAEIKVRKDFDATPTLEIASGALTPGPSAKAILVDVSAGTARVYVGSTLMAALNAEQFTETNDEGDIVFTGVWDFELVNPTLERFRYVMGPVVFSREVTA